jgi:protein AroM
LLEPQRIIPPLVASIVDGHQVGVIVPVEEIMPMQQQKWLSLENAPYYALANPFSGSDSELFAREGAAGAGRRRAGAGLPRLPPASSRRITKALDVPVLLSNVLVSRLAAELLV